MCRGKSAFIKKDLFCGKGRDFIYLALYRKYRPRTFADVISQPHITKTLTNQLKNRQTSHAYLFTGSRGTGKTTCAKILAQAVNCLDLKDGNPCLVCDNCRLIEAGTPDIVEIDAASNNGVDDVRALRDEIVYLPVTCKYRVYIIDEVHMLSTSAFNALLKTLEEPPEHVVFILATTENHKVPATVLSRCQRFEFHRINISDSAERLLEIADKESVVLEKPAAELISRISDGGMRDALSLLDTCLSMNSHVTSDVVRECAGVAGNQHLFMLSNAIIDENCGYALNIVNELHKNSKDMARLIDEMINHYRNFMMLKLVPDDFEFGLISEEAVEYRNFSDKIDLAEIMRILDILIESYDKILHSKERKTLTEICMVRLCNRKLGTDGDSLLARIEEMEREWSRRMADNYIPKVENRTDNTNSIYKEKSEDLPVAPESVSIESKSETIKTETEFRQWGEVLSLLPNYITSFLHDCDICVDGERFVISCGNITGSIISNPDNNEKIKSALKIVTGIDYIIEHRCIKSEVEKEENTLDRFMKRVEMNGVKIITR